MVQDDRRGLASDSMAYSNFEVGVVFTSKLTGEKASDNVLYVAAEGGKSAPRSRMAKVIPLPVPYEIERHEKYWVDENDSDRENFSKPFRYIPHFNTHEGLRIFEKCQMLPLPPPRAPTLVNSLGRFDHAAAIVRHKHETGLIGESSSSRNSSNDDMIKGILGVGTRRDARGNVVGASGAMPSFSTESQVVNEYLNEALERGDLDEALHILLQVPRRRDYVEWREF